MYFIIFNSVTLANRVKSYFQYDRAFVGMVHTPVAIGVNGCSYSLKVNREKVREVLSVADAMGIRVKGVYRQVGDNEYVEVPL